MSKMKISISTIAMFMLLSMFSVVAFGAGHDVAKRVTGLSSLYSSKDQKVTISWTKLADATEYTLVWDTKGVATSQTVPQPTEDTVKVEIPGVTANDATYTYYILPVGATGDVVKNYGVVTAQEMKVINAAQVKNDGKTVEGHRTHGDFQNNTNACATCHSTHNATSNGKLLKYTNTTDADGCTACHDGTMGFYSVQASGHDASVAGTFGNFTAANGLNDETDNDRSMHNVDGSQALNAAPHQGATKNGTGTFKCSSCHAAHGGTKNDRLILETVNGVPWATVDDSAKNTPYKYFTEGKAPAGNGTQAIDLDHKAKTDAGRYFYLELEKMPISEQLGFSIYKSHGPEGDAELQTTPAMFYNKFCFSCHEGLNKTKTVAGDSSNAQPEDYGHKTHSTQSGKYGRNCYSCHYAHGTDDTTLMDTAGRMLEDVMKPVDELVNKATVGTGYTPSEYTAYGLGLTEAEGKAYLQDYTDGGSKLKKFTNSAVCYACHTTASAMKNATHLPDYNAAGKPTK